MPDTDETPQDHQDEEPVECFRCGVCCTGYYAMVTREEIETMADYLSIKTNEFISKYILETQVGYLLQQTENGCVFLIREKDTYETTCSIYPARPEVCSSLVPGLSQRQCREGLELLKKKRR